MVGTAVKNQNSAFFPGIMITLQLFLNEKIYHLAALNVKGVRNGSFRCNKTETFDGSKFFIHHTQTL